MNINDLISEIEAQIKNLISRYEFSLSFYSRPVKQNQEKEIQELKEIQNNFELLATKVRALSNNSSSKNYKKIQKDLELLLRAFKSKYIGYRQEITTIQSEIIKLHQKYNIANEKIDADKTTPEQTIHAIQESLVQNPLALAEQVKDEKRAETVSKTVSQIKQSIESIELEQRIDRAAKTAKATRAKRIAEQLEEEQSTAERTAKIEEIKSKKRAIRSKSETEEAIKIRYEAQNDCYYINEKVAFSKPIKLKKIQKERFIKSKLKDKKVFDLIFDKYDPAHAKALKKCDPYILLILAQKDLTMAKNYIRKLAGQRPVEGQKYSYEMVYDIRGISHIPKKEISFFDKLYIKRTINYNKKLSKVVEDKKQIKWYTVIPVVGALAISGIAGFLHNKNSNKENPKNSYVDTIRPDDKNTVGTSPTETSKFIMKTPSTTTQTVASTPRTTVQTIDSTPSTTVQTTASIPSTTVKTMASTPSTTVKTIASVQTTTAQTTASSPSIVAQTVTSTPSTTVQTIVTTTANSSSVSSNNSSTTTQPVQESTTQKSNDSTKTQTTPDDTVSVKIGDKINIKDGQKYTSDCLGGGNSSKIGAVSWRPATGYYVDGIAYTYNGNILRVSRSEKTDVRATLTSLANEYGVKESEIDTSVLLSLIPGSGDTGWTSISVDELEQIKEESITQTNNSTTKQTISNRANER